LRAAAHLVLGKLQAMLGILHSAALRLESLYVGTTKTKSNKIHWLLEIGPLQRWKQSSIQKELPLCSSYWITGSGPTLDNLLHSNMLCYSGYRAATYYLFVSRSTAAIGIEFLSDWLSKRVCFYLVQQLGKN